MSGSSGQSVLRQAVEGLLRARADAERGLDDVTAWVTRAALRPSETARAGRHPLARRAADDAAMPAGAMPGALAALSAATRTAIATEVHALLSLLAVDHHQLPPLPPLDARPLAGPGDRAFLSAFSEGFARSYVATVLGDLSSGRPTSKADAAAHPGAQQATIDAARDRIVAAVEPEHRALVRAWLSHPDCHAVEIHGPQVGDRDLELRAGWTRPPDHGAEGADSWRVRDDGKVVSKHQVMVDAGAFTSADAFVRPLEAFMTVARRHPDGIEGFLRDHSVDGVAPFFINAQLGRLAPGDAVAHRGAGTGTPQAARDWVRMRRDAMKKDHECIAPVRTIPYDPIADGPDPGVRLVFKRGEDGWVMVTYYPSDSPAPDNQRLEDIT
ncbi:hypothetical protein [Jiangella endophytica]|uniref:hypothetical protein n=1 Tax=Jiangella endophytica TaxID=1623398 RepID=UPI001300BC4E|nr:hypothetical protein [Jiangella endophytica]